MGEVKLVLAYYINIWWRVLRRESVYVNVYEEKTDQGTEGGRDRDSNEDSKQRSKTKNFFLHIHFYLIKFKSKIHDTYFIST